MKLRTWSPTMESTIMSMHDREKLPIGHVLYRLVKSTHICHLPLELLIRTRFNSHFKYCASLMNPVANSRSTSLAMVVYFSALKLLYFFLNFLNSSPHTSDVQQWNYLAKHVLVAPSEDF